MMRLAFWFMIAPWEKLNESVLSSDLFCGRWGICVGPSCYQLLLLHRMHSGCYTLEPDKRWLHYTILRQRNCRNNFPVVPFKGYVCSRSQVGIVSLSVCLRMHLESVHNIEGCVHFYLEGEFYANIIDPFPRQCTKFNVCGFGSSEKHTVFWYDIILLNNFIQSC